MNLESVRGRLRERVNTRANMGVQEVENGTLGTCIIQTSFSDPVILNFKSAFVFQSQRKASRHSAREEKPKVVDNRGT